MGRRANATGKLPVSWLLLRLISSKLPVHSTMISCSRIYRQNMQCGWTHPDRNFTNIWSSMAYSYSGLISVTSEKIDKAADNGLHHKGLASFSLNVQACNGKQGQIAWRHCLAECVTYVRLCTTKAMITSQLERYPGGRDTACQEIVLH